MSGPGRLSVTSRPDRPLTGLLDLSLAWETLAGSSLEPGYLGRLGPVTSVQARELAEVAAADPAVQWRVILTTQAGQAIAVTRVPPGRDGRRGQVRAATGSGLVGRVTLTLPEDILGCPPPLGTRLSQQETPGLTRPPGDAPSDAPLGILARALRAAGRAAADAARRAAADAAAESGCAHIAAVPGYRPPPRLREYIVARDLTCRFPYCRQPAWRGDLDHTQPYEQGGLTCRCNLGGLCRHHHILKQHAGWELVQVEPGVFWWVTPAGRSYRAVPDNHAR